MTYITKQPIKIKIVKILYKGKSLVWLEAFYHFKCVGYTCVTE